MNSITIFSVYGAKVAEGEWRDYSIDFLKDRAVFSIFRRSSERPLYRIEKNPRLTNRQGAYSVVAMTGLILKRGHDLAKVLRVLDRKLSRGQGWRAPSGKKCKGPGRRRALCIKDLRRFIACRRRAEAAR